MSTVNQQPVNSAGSNWGVEIVQRGGAFTLLRNGQPYRIRGVGGRTRLQQAAQLGANSVRIWGSEDAPSAFAAAERLDLTVFLGIWLSHEARDYSDEGYKQSKRDELRRLLATYAKHPSLLVWALGNEIQLGANVPAAWQFVEELAQMVAAGDGRHPIATVIAHAPPEVLADIVQYAPSIELLGVNSYGGLSQVPQHLQESAFRGPIVITEWGPDGHWEVARTSWGRPLEQSSAEKAEVYAERFRLIDSWRERCLGSYVFQWGQKQERTPTWYGLFLEQRPELGLEGQGTAQLDAVVAGWQGHAVQPPAPEVRGLRIEDKEPTDDLVVAAGQQLRAQALVSGTSVADLQYRWELLREPTQLGEGGSHEVRPESLPAAVEAHGERALITAPQTGEYRLFVYALQGGKAGTANFPFRVR